MDSTLEFFGSYPSTEVAAPATAEEAIREGQQFAFSRFVTRGIQRKILEGEQINLDKITQKMTDSMCAYTSLREAYYLWDNASHLFNTIIVLESDASRSDWTVFKKNKEWQVHDGVIAEDMEGNWFFSSSANYNPNSAPKPLYTDLLREKTLDELMVKIEESETKVHKYGLHRLFPTANEIRELLKNNAERKPSVLSLNFVDETELKNPFQEFTRDVKYFALDPYQFDELELRENREKCRCLRVPMIRRFNDPFDSITEKNRLTSRIVVIPKD